MKQKIQKLPRTKLNVKLRMNIIQETSKQRQTYESQ